MAGHAFLPGTVDRPPRPGVAQRCAPLRRSLRAAGVVPSPPPVGDRDTTGTTTSEQIHLLDGPGDGSGAALRAPSARKLCAAHTDPKVPRQERFLEAVSTDRG